MDLAIREQVVKTMVFAFYARYSVSVFDQGRRRSRCTSQDSYMILNALEANSTYSSYRKYDKKSTYVALLVESLLYFVDRLLQSHET